MCALLCTTGSKTKWGRGRNPAPSQLSPDQAQKRATQSMPRSSFQSTLQNGATWGTRSSPSAEVRGPGTCLVPVHNQGLHSTSLSRGTEP